MALVKTLLVPVDFSSGSQSGVRLAARLAGKLEARAILLHVMPPRRRAGEEDGYEGGESPNEADAYGAEQLAEIAQGAGLKASEQLIEEGEAPQVICREAEQRGADLIVLSTRGLGAYRPNLLGSNTAKVLHDTAVPVLTTVHRNGSRAADKPIDSIVCSVDLNRPNLESLRWARDLAMTLGAKLSALYVAPEFPIEEQAPVDFQSTLLASSRRRMAEVLAEAGVEAEAVVDTGRLGSTVAAAVQRLSGDLLVLGRRSASEGRVTGHTFEILRASPCPVASI